MALYTHKGLVGSPSSAWYETIGTSYVAVSSTLIVYADPGGTETRLKGTFAVNGAGVVTGGTITSVQRTAPGSATVYETITGIPSVPVLNFINSANSIGKMASVLGGGDTFLGHSGTDFLRGFGGTDSFAGGLGSDQYFVEDSGETVTEGSNAGTDQVTTTLSSYTLGANLENLVFSGSGGFAGTGNGLDNVIVGGAGTDTLNGGDGNDTLNGQGGQNTLNGGTGNDTYYINSATDTIIDSSGTNDHVYGYVQTYIIPAAIEIFTYQGSGNANVTGHNSRNNFISGAGNDIFHGLGGDDEFYSWSGEDTFHGGIGNDKFFVDSAGDVVVEAALEGINDTVYASMSSYTLTANVENLAHGEDTNFAGTGNELDNLVSGGGGEDVLKGMAGKDTLVGNGGNDILEGGAADDLISGDGDNDILDGGAGADNLNGGDHFDTASYVNSASAVQVNLSTGLGTGGEAQGDILVQIEAVLGSAHHDLLAGNAVANTFRGGGGNDTVDGGGDVDTVQFSGAASEYLIRKNLDGTVRVTDTVAARDGADTLIDVEFLSFSDQNVVVADLETVAGYSFDTTKASTTQFKPASGWVSQDTYPRKLADINGDQFDDIVAFGNAGVFVSLSKGDGSFAPMQLVSGQFGAAAGAGGWSSDNTFPRQLADVNGDGRADIVAFGNAGVLVALANGTGGFGPTTLALADLGKNQGWSPQSAFPRQLADVNGDGRNDIVAFGNSTYVSLGNADGTFGAASIATVEFAAGDGWVSDNATPRRLADVNGDGNADIVGFSAVGVYVGLSNGDGTFGSEMLATPAFGADTGWTGADKFPRHVADANGDGRADIIGFGNAGVLLALGQANGTFGTLSLVKGEFGLQGGWSTQTQFPRLTGDIDGDGAADILAFGSNSAFVSLSKESGFLPASDSIEFAAAFAGGADELPLDTGESADTSLDVQLSSPGGEASAPFLFDQLDLGTYFGGDASSLLV